MTTEKLEELKLDIKAKIANRVLTTEEATELGLWVMGTAIKEAFHQAVEGNAPD